MPFHTEAFTQIRFDIYTPIHTEAFRHRLFFRESQKLWHREAFTPRIFYTQKLLHTQAFPQRLLHREAFEHRSFYTQTPLHTEACTHRGFYAQKLLHREAFTDRRFPTEKPIPQSSFYTLQKIAVLRKFLTFGHHIVRKGYIRRWKIATFDLIKSQFYTSFISRETVVPDVSKWIKSQFYNNASTFASDVKKSQFSRSYCRLTFMPRLHLNFQNHNFTPVFDGWPSFRAKGLRRVPPNLHFATCVDVRPARSQQRVARAQKKCTFHHMLGRSKRTISAEGGPRTNKTRISPHVWVSDTPQRVTFRKPPPGCPCFQREIEWNRRTEEFWFCRSSDTIWLPGS